MGTPYIKDVDTSMVEAIFTQLPVPAKKPTIGNIGAFFALSLKDATKGTITIDSQYQELLDGICSMPDLQARSLLAYVATSRYNHQNGGITLNGMAIATDSVSQGLINGAVNLVSLDKTVASIDFKGPNGYVLLSAAQVTAIGVAIGGFVQKCYSAEKAIMAKVTNGTYKTKTDVDNASEWASTVITTS